eukprot:1791220-Rhodomonas_salina.1
MSAPGIAEWTATETAVFTSPLLQQGALQWYNACQQRTSHINSGGYYLATRRSANMAVGRIVGLPLHTLVSESCITSKRVGG